MNLETKLTRVAHLILADPWGFAVHDPSRISHIPAWVSMLLINPFMPTVAFNICCQPPLNSSETIVL